MTVSKSHTAPSARTVALPPNYWRYVVQACVLALALIAALTLLFLWPVEPNTYRFQAGEASSTDILSPRRITYVSEIATQAERDRAASAVKEVYTAADPEIIRQQLAHARDVFNYMTTVRHDPYLPASGRVEAVLKIPDLNVAASVIRTAMAFDDLTWQRTISTTLKVSEEVMLQGIRENQLLEARSRLSTLLISDILPAEQEKVVVGIARAFIKPTSFYDEAATVAAREQARAQVQPVKRTIEKGQAILRAGDIVTSEDLEELTALEMIGQEREWQSIVGVMIFSTFLVAIPGAFIQRLRPGFWARWRRLLFVCLITLLGVGLAKSMIPNHVLLPYLFPMAAISMTLTLVLEDTTLAILVTAMLSLAVGFISDLSLEMTTLNLVSGTVAALGIHHRERLFSFVRVGILVAITNIAISLAFRLTSQDYDWAALSQLVSAGLLNGGLCASLSFATYTWIGRIFGITSALQLLDLARPTQPLLKQLALKAPGTYHHTIIVANMAEQAAEAIGANSILARIGAYYHDIGKIARPYFFIENATEEDNIHSRLDPRTSAQIIVSHTRDGLQMARKQGLPAEVQDIIVQHHGTTLVSFFYQQALEQAAAGEVIKESDFRYPGPKPQSKEAAIVMLADVEAVVRSSRPTSLSETEKIIRQFISTRLLSGELDECSLTLRDLDLIREAFVGVLKGVFHPRIQYPAPPAPQPAVAEPIVAQPPATEASGTAQA